MNTNLDPEHISNKDSEFEKRLRPLSFDDFTGQQKAIENLKIFVAAAKMRGESLDHVLLHGPPGLGKTTLSNIIANELGVNFKITSGPVLDKPGDLAGILTSLEENDVLFIDASQHFEKVKTQNVLRNEDIEKIVTTYRNRSEEAKYSKLATLADIAGNDYNLNIPRYVDTFEAEESIDINQLTAELVALDKAMAETDKTIASYCKELNIPTPF